MNLQDAVEALKQGSKVRLKGWSKKSYIKMSDDIDPEIKLYDEFSNYFIFDNKTLLTDGWYSIGKEEIKYNFPEMLKQVRLGKLCRKDNWEEGKYLIYDRQTRDIVIKQTVEVPSFHMNLDSLILEEWEIFKED